MLKWVNNTAPTNIMDVNGMYEGFIVDLMNELAQIVGFRFRLVPVWDGKFGYRKPDGSWDGMVGEVLRRVSSFLLFLWLTTQILRFSPRESRKTEER